MVGCQCQWCAGFLLDQENQEIIFWPGKPGKKPGDWPMTGRFANYSPKIECEKQFSRS